MGDEKYTGDEKADSEAKDDDRRVFFAVCQTHNFEGMRRDTPGEAALDLSGHMEWFPDEPHSGARIRQEDLDDDKSTQKGASEAAEARPGSAYRNCNGANRGRWRPSGEFDLGESGGRVRVKAQSGEVSDQQLTCIGDNGKRYVFRNINSMSGETKHLAPGKYRMEIEYRYGDIGGQPRPHRVTFFVHWWPREE